MVNRVKLSVLDHFEEMREFQGDHPIGSEQIGQTLGKVINVGHVGVHIVADNKVCPFSLRGQPLCQSPSEKFPDYGDPQVFCGLRGAGGRLNAQTGNAGSDEVLQ